MRDVYLAGIDIGTTGAKAILSDGEGCLVAQAGQEYPTAYPHANWAEQNPGDWWRATCQVVHRVLAQAGVDPKLVAAISVSDQAPSLVAVDRGGEPLAPAVIWMDRRSEEQCAWMRQAVGQERIAAINGGRIDPYFLAPKLLWFKEHAPELYARTHQVLQANGYITYRLCGAFSMDTAVGPLTMLFDSAARCWSAELIAAMGLDAAKLPPAFPCAQIVGRVTPAAAAASGFAAGTPVLAGMVDGAAAAVEAGLVRPGQAVEMTGQSTVLMVGSDRSYQGLDLFPLGHAIPGVHLVVGAMVATGGSLRWFRDQLGQEEIRAAAQLGVDPFELLSRAAESSLPGANHLIFLPYMYGERSPIWDTDARGVLFVLPAASSGAAMGDAIIAAAAAGLYPSVEDAVAHMVTQGATFYPRPEYAALYDELYAIFRDLYPTLRPNFHRLGALP